MKEWKKAEIISLNLSSTSNQPAANIAVDDLVNGVFVYGLRDGSGTSSNIIYTPTI